MTRMLILNGSNQHLPVKGARVLLVFGTTGRQERCEEVVGIPLLTATPAGSVTTRG